jgi:hypothetical protein
VSYVPLHARILVGLRDSTVYFYTLRPSLRQVTIPLARQEYGVPIPISAVAQTLNLDVRSTGLVRVRCEGSEQRHDSIHSS